MRISGTEQQQNITIIRQKSSLTNGRKGSYSSTPIVKNEDLYINVGKSWNNDSLTNNAITAKVPVNWET